MRFIRVFGYRFIPHTKRITRWLREGIVVTYVGFINTILRFLNLFCRHMVDAKTGYLVRNQYFEGFWM